MEGRKYNVAAVGQREKLQVVDEVFSDGNVPSI